MIIMIITDVIIVSCYATGPPKLLSSFNNNNLQRHLYKLTISSLLFAS